MSQEVRKVALVPLSKLELLRSDAQSSQSMMPDTVSQPAVADANLRKSLNLHNQLVQVANDTTMEDDEKLQKYLTVLRHYVIFRDKYLSSQQRKTLTHDEKQGKPRIEPEQQPENQQEVKNVERPISPNAYSAEHDKYYLSALKGHDKKKGSEILRELKLKPGFEWNAEGEISINGIPIPGSNLKDLLTYETIKYSQKGSRIKPPAGYGWFIGFLKSVGISPHKTSRETRQLKTVKVVNTSKRKLKFDTEDDDEFLDAVSDVKQSKQTGSGVFYWDKY
jgi:hypothetical protein